MCVNEKVNTASTLRIDTNHNISENQQLTSNIAEFHVIDESNKGRNTVMQCNLNDTSMKQIFKMLKQSGFDPTKEYFVLRNKVLQETENIHRYDIRNQNNIFVFYRLIGGNSEQLHFASYEMVW